MKRLQLNTRLLEPYLPIEYLPLKDLHLEKSGSVKDIYSYKDSLIFVFTDHFSAFDWGKMPDKIPNKGTALLAHSLFLYLFMQKGPADLSDHPELIEKWFGQHALIVPNDLPPIDHHIQSLIVFTDQDNSLYGLKVARVQYPGSDEKVEDFYKNRPTKALVPLECIFRPTIGKQSSVWDRPEWSQRLSRLSSKLDVNEKLLLNPVELDWSTKLEAKDRYLNPIEAQMIAGLDQLEWELLGEMVRTIGLYLDYIYQKIGVILIDGKIELAFASQNSKQTRGFNLVDSIGPDELRLEKDQALLSKERLRAWYRQTDWYQQFKYLQQTEGHEQARKVMTAPPALPSNMIKECSTLYTDITNQLTQYFWSEDILITNKRNT
jgi:phosphoribosylaminoimidazole-succinocarboxamide synthase